MKMNIFFAILFWSTQFVVAQESKPLIDSSVYNKWPSVGSYNISNNGEFVIYTLMNYSLEHNNLIIQSTRNNWKMEFIDVPQYSCKFTRDSKNLIFIKDSLYIVELGKNNIKYLQNVEEFNLIENGDRKWLIYKVKDARNELVLYNLITSENKHFYNIENYYLSNNGRILALQKEEIGDRNKTHQLELVNLYNYNTVGIWNGAQIKQLIFDSKDNQIVFSTTEDVNNQPNIFFWYFKLGAIKPILLIDNSSSMIDSSLQLGDISGFDKKDNKILFSLQEKDITQSKQNSVDLNIWSYKDTKLQSQQLKEGNPKRSYKSLIYINSHRIIRLEQKNEYCTELGDEIAIIRSIDSDVENGESNWNTAAHSKLYLMNIKNNERKLVCENSQLIFRKSPRDKYLIYYDPLQHNYFSYTINTGITKNITRNIPTNWTVYGNDLPNNQYAVDPPAGWLKDDTAVLLYDQNDIWQLDPAAIKPPINITNKLGKNHNIVFRLAIEADTDFFSNKRILLSAFDRTTKHNGFYNKKLGKSGDPELLTMGPYMYYAPSNYLGYAPVKAKDADFYLVKRMDATESPNLFCTKDFKNFKKLSNNYPEKEYNWVKSELYTWRSLDSTICQGILYKPENFDSSNKYPLIFYYYERFSDKLNVYLEPEASDGRLNISKFVSNGYLVFVPDIYYKIGEPGQSAYNSVVSAANYLLKMPWVDSSKMGLQGISFGGYETNYLITHTNIFAAACSSAGLSDFVSGYGSLSGDGFSLQSLYELSQNRIGATLWERPDLYIKNSPIFFADKVTTPLLMMHVKDDGVCPFTQALELFIALRRLGKKVWMLEYTEGNHGIWGKSALDFSIRMTQFFDYYLKNSLPAKWMTEGISAKMKGVKTGLEIDKEAITP
jgi:dienelactone hydrolase